MVDTSRRSFLRRTGIATSASIIGTPSASAQSGSTRLHLEGRIQEATNQPAEDDLIHVSAHRHEFESPYFETNEGGVFHVDLDHSDTLYLGYYQMFENWTRIPAPERDGSPDIFDLRCCIEVSDRPVNLGSIQLPPAHLLHVKAVDESGNPVSDARVRVVHSIGGGGYGSGTHTTNSKGLLQYADLESAGTELVGDVLIQMSPPSGDNRFVDATYERDIHLTGPRTETFVLNEQ